MLPLPDEAAKTRSERWEAINAIFSSSELAKYRRLQVLALRIATRANTKLGGWAYPSQESLAAELHTQKRDIQQGVRALTGEGDNSRGCPKLSRPYLISALVPVKAQAKRYRTFYCIAKVQYE